MQMLEDFVPADHPLRPIRQMFNAALVKMDVLFSRMYEADVKGGRPSIAPEKFLRTPKTGRNQPKSSRCEN